MPRARPSAAASPFPADPSRQAIGARDRVTRGTPGRRKSSRCVNLEGEIRSSRLPACSFLSSSLQTGDSRLRIRNAPGTRWRARLISGRTRTGGFVSASAATFQHFGGGENDKKIYDLRKTLIIPIHKARSILVRRYAAVGHASGLIKNDDRKGRKLRGAYRPINSTSASICLSPSLPLSLSLSLSLFRFLIFYLFLFFPSRTLRRSTVSLLSSPSSSSPPSPPRTHYVPQNPCNYRRPSTN